MRKLGVSLTVMLLWLTGLAADAAKIGGIKIQTKGGEPFSEEIIKANISSRVGDEFNAERLTRDIEQIYKTGLVTDVEAQVTAEAEGQMTIVFVVQPVSRVHALIIEGNEELKTKVLRDRLTVQSGEPIDRRQVAEDTAALRRLYDEKGFYGTEVTSLERQLPGSSEVDVIFRVQEAPRHKVGGVEFVGNTVFTNRQLRKALQTRRTFWSRIFSVGYYSDEKFEFDQSQLGRMYADEGYLDFRIAEVKKSYSDDGGRVYLTLVLDEGAVYRVISVKIEGNRLFGEDELRPLVSLGEGMVFRPSIQSADCRAIESRYRPLGYLDMACRALPEKNSAEHTIGITYRVTEGIPSRIQDIYISGNVITKDEVIRRELRVLPGDLADSNKIEASRAILRNLNYFESVVVAPKSTEREDLRDIEVRVEEKRTGQLMLGAGISSEDAIVGTLEVSQANFDITNWPTFTGGGQRMRLRLQLGTKRDEFLLSFVEPWWLDRRLRLETSLFRTLRNEAVYDRENTGVEGSVAWQWREFWRQSVGLRLQQVSLDDFTSDASAELLAEAGDYTSITLLYSLTYDRRDRYVNPTRGSRLELTAELQPEALGGYNTLYRLGAKGSQYHPFGASWVLRLQGEIAVVDDLSGDDVAIFDRFFAGGATSFRGFDRREVSPVDVNEDSVGGKSLLLGTVEMIYSFTEKTRGSLFTDFGNVWRNAYDWDPADINVSVGVGIQFDLGIGPIRLDYGFPIVTTEDHLDGGGRLHFNLGYYF